MIGNPNSSAEAPAGPAGDRRPGDGARSHDDPAGARSRDDAAGACSGDDPAATRPVALVTGAARRIGRCVALALAAGGWDIALHYGRSRDDALATQADVQAHGVRCCVLPADLADEAATRALVPAAVHELGRLDAVINSASHFQLDDVAGFSHATLARHMLPNLAAPILLAGALAAHAGSRGAPVPAVVVNLLDQKLFNLNPDFLSYTLSKAALQTATTMLAQALAPHVRVVGVAPGLTLPSYLQDDDGFAAAHAATSPLGRCSTVDDVADAVLFAVRNRALTGTVLLVDGGQHLHALPRDVSLLDPTTSSGDRS